MSTHPTLARAIHILHVHPVSPTTVDIRTFTVQVRMIVYRGAKVFSRPISQRERGLQYRKRRQLDDLPYKYNFSEHWVFELGTLSVLEISVHEHVLHPCAITHTFLPSTSKHRTFVNAARPRLRTAIDPSVLTLTVFPACFDRAPLYVRLWSCGMPWNGCINDIRCRAMLRYVQNRGA